MAKKCMSKDLEKIYDKFKEVAGNYGVKNTIEYKKIDDLISRWIVSCIVEESLAKKGARVVYGTVLSDDSIEFN